MSLSGNKVLIALVLVLGLAGCTPSMVPVQSAVVGVDVALRRGQTVGQTFVARQDGLDGIEIFMTLATPAAGEIRLHLRSTPQSSTDLAVATFLLDQVGAPAFYRFSFSPQSHSRGEAYYVLLDLLGDGEVKVGSAPGDSYLDGALYQNANPVDAQLTFHLLYDPGAMVWGWLTQVAEWVFVLVAALFLFILPGLALLTLWTGSSALGWTEKIGLASGVGIALYPVLILWTNLAQMHWGAFYAWLPGLVALAVLIWQGRPWS
jgi:hypothetical protein